MRTIRTFFSSSTTSSVSRKPDPKSPRSLAVPHRPWVTSQPSPRKWPPSKSGSPRPTRVRSPRSRRSMCRRTTSPTPPPPTPSLTSTPPSCSSARSPSKRFSQPSIRLPRPPKHSLLKSSAKSTIASLAACSKCSNATRTCRTSSPFSAWTSFPPKTNSPSSAPAKSNASSPSPSTSRKFSPTSPACSARSKTRSAASPKSSTASGTMCPKATST